MQLRGQITFTGTDVDRAALRRRDVAWLDQARSAASTRLVAVGPATKLLVADGSCLCRLDPAFLGEEPGLTFLGLDSKGGAIFALDCGSEGPGLEGFTFEELRALAAVLPAGEAAIAAHAVAMVGWHRRHRYCGACGSPTEVQEGGHSRRCTACGLQHFPRTDPAVIMLVTDGQRAVLGRRPGAGGRWSVLAGFVEPGETLEHAVAREVQEEVGLRVVAARYLGSQPWPFPANLMLGFEARAEPGPIRLDDELEEARWFTRQDLRDTLSQRGVDIPAPISIAHHLIQAWLAAGS